MIWPPDDNEDTETFSKAEWDEIIKNLRSPEAISYPCWQPKTYECTCGAEKVHGPKTGHSHWCDKVRI